MDLVVVWWSFAGTWGLVCRHLMDLVVVWWSFAVTWEEEGEEVVWGHLLDLGSTFRQHLKMIQSTILAQRNQHELSGHSLRCPARRECHYSQNCKSPTPKKGKKCMFTQKCSKGREGTRRMKATNLHQKTE